MQTNFTAAQLADPDSQRVRKDLARLRALRLLHRDLPDLCAARRRARQPEGPHLSHQGDAGERPPGDARGGQAYRPLPLVPVVHDDLPVGRQLHASRRSRPTPYREDVQAAVVRPDCCGAPSGSCCRAHVCFARALRASRFGAPFAGLLPERLKAALALVPSKAAAAFAGRPAAGLQERGRSVCVASRS